ncbi:MAG: hypothetical protein AAFN79_05465 [Pseudomonadota bacterium]
MTRIAIAAGLANPILSPSNQALAEALIAEGAEVETLLWNRDGDAAFLATDLTLLRQTWDYQRDLAAYAAWIGRLSARGARIDADPRLALWNNDKRTLAEVTEAGVETPAMASADGAKGADLAAALGPRFVLKPAVGGSGYGVVAADAASINDQLAEAWTEAPGRPFIAQTFLPEIAAGEWKVMCVAGAPAFAVRAAPAAGEFRINSRFAPTIEVAEAPAPAWEAAERILHWLRVRFGQVPLAVRVDGVMRGDVFICTELEMTDPDMFLNLRPAAAQRLAKAAIALAEGA